MKNNSLREIAQVLHEAKSILLFPHVNLDGDALGSCAALCRTLRLQERTYGSCWKTIFRQFSFGQRILHMG
ncbi:MAG: hypothetical protein ACLVHQ_03515 [Oscillospiraceae bacterium]